MIIIYLFGIQLNSDYIAVIICKNNQIGLILSRRMKNQWDGGLVVPLLLEESKKLNID